MTNAKLIAEIDALYEKATKGPWSAGTQKTLSCLSGSKTFVDARGINVYEKCNAREVGDQHKHNALLIVALVNAWPQLRRAALAEKGEGNG